MSGINSLQENSVQIPPVRSHANFHQQRHRERVNSFHLFPHQGPHRVDFRFRHFEHQFIVHLQGSSLDFRPRRCRAASMRIMAILIKSAAVPCKGVFTAVRSAKPRRLAFLLLMSGIGRTRPKSVLHFSVAASFFQRSVDESPHAFVFLEIGVDELLGLAGSIPRFCESPNADRPYTIPKFTTLAWRR